VDTTFDADLGTGDNDISALSIHLDCHGSNSYGTEHGIDVPDNSKSKAGASGFGCVGSSSGSLVDELGLCFLGCESGGDGENVTIRAKGARNPIATTLHCEHVVMQHGKAATRSLLVPGEELPHFTKTRSPPGSDVAYPVPICPSVRHGGR